MLVTRVGPSCRLEERTWGGSYSARGWRCRPMRRDPLLGDAAAKALTGQPLGSARGRVHRIEGVRAVATFHPRWLLQRPSDKALAWKDLQLLMSEEG